MHLECIPQVKALADAVAGSAGILRFYGEKTASSLKVRPEIIIVLAVILMLAVVLAGWLI